MMSISITDEIRLIAFWLCFIRWMGFLSLIPIFDEVAIPGNLKVFFSLVIAFAFFPLTESAVIHDIYYVGVNNFWILTISYLLIGLFLGFMVKLIMDITVIAGTIISQNIGLGAVRYFDPNQGQRVGPFETLLQWSLLLMVICSGALLPMFKGLYLSFDHFSLMNIKNLNITPEQVNDFFWTIILCGLVLSVPILMTNLLISLIMGITSRTIPQMNILLVSFIVNIALGFFVFFITSDDFFHESYKMYVDVLGKWFVMIT